MESNGNSKITGIGAFTPTQRVTSNELMREVGCDRFGIADDYISSNIGILEKRVADPTMEPSDLAVLASEAAIRDAGIRADEIDLILYTGITRDCEEPATAHLVQNKIGAPKAICIDVSNACLGFMTGLSLADSMLASGQAKTVLVCTGETPSRIMFEFFPQLIETRDIAVFKKMLGVLTVGDAGGAMIVQPKAGSEQGWNWFGSQSDGRHSKLCYYKKSGTSLEGQMVMDKICALTLKAHEKLMQTTIAKLSCVPENVDKVYCHQVGAPPHSQLLKRTGLESVDAPISFDLFGNLTSATIPVLMNLFKPKPKERLLFFCSGSGISVFQGGMQF